MKKYRPAIILFGVLALCAMFFIVLGQISRAIVPPERTYVVDQVRVGAVDVTAQLDLDQVAVLIRGYRCAVLPKPMYSGYRDQMIEVNGRTDQGPLHLVLNYHSPDAPPILALEGANLVYESGDRGGYIIREGDKLKKELLSMLPPELLPPEFQI